MNGTAVRQLDAMPACVGPATGEGCQVRPAWFCVGEDLVDGKRVVLYAAVCDEHAGPVSSYLDQPIGCWWMPYEVHVFRTLEEGLDGQYEGAWQLARPSAVAG